ncbi:unnamed protein product [Sphenostylis stenocarpa]|uniref:Protein kinase domain-containing protein n=1 Tax=Sphenostylis stenocarpa TaxID=92480 RepID=A0AA86SAH5_9FABA|nr:unnamed protein product [Sphenostylis stenocarpa]
MVMIEWERLRILGEGSYSIVYLAELRIPEEGKRMVIAMKSSKPHGLHSLQKEGGILESFSGSKEIVECMWSITNEENGCAVCHLLMELAPYGCLGDLIRRKPFSESQVIVSTRMILKGLSLIHKAGVVHCDLKPDNLLLFPPLEEGVEFQLKIADFGLAKTKEDKCDGESREMKFRGSPFYMSPESVRGEIETALDIWSLGCIIIEMMTGLPAWHHISSTRHLMFILAFPKQSPPIPSWLSLCCQDFLSKCFSKDPNQRWTATMLQRHPFLL